jgi:hypothetical protein
MNKDEPVTIEKVANGWIVRPSYHPGRGDYALDSKNEIFIFETFVSMITWLDEHFTKPEKVQ